MGVVAAGGVPALLAAIHAAPSINSAPAIRTSAAPLALESGSYETGRCDWQTGDELRAAGNVRYRVTAVIPEDLVAEFIDKPLAGILEVERV